MKARHIILVVVSLALILLAVWYLAPPAQRFGNVNRLHYLRNAHRYAEALQAYEELIQADPKALEALDDFKDGTIRLAMEHFTRVGEPATPIDRQRLDDFLQQIEPRPELAPHARRLLLLLTARRDGASSTTLQAARAILTHEGYDPEALWWAVLSQYDPGHPLEAPAELLAYRQIIEIPEPLNTNDADSPTSGLTHMRKTFFGALLALAERDWAGGAARFERYGEIRRSDQRLRDAPGPSYRLAYAESLLRSGRPEAAVIQLSESLRTHPDDAPALAALTRGWLAQANYPRAAHAIRDLMRVAPATRDDLLAARFDVPDAASGAPPRMFSKLCRSLAEEGPYRGDAPLWGFLEAIAEGPAEQKAVSWVALNLANLPGPPRDQVELLFSYYLRHERPDAARRLIQTLRAGRPTTPTMCLALERTIDWYTTRTPAVRDRLTLHSQSVGALLTENKTHHFELTLPPTASHFVLLVQGYPVDGIWPIIHVDLGRWGERSYYLHDYATRAQPILLKLRWPPPDRATQITAAVSLINGDAQGRRNVNITQALVF